MTKNRFIINTPISPAGGSVSWYTQINQLVLCIGGDQLRQNDLGSAAFINLVASPRFRSLQERKERGETNEKKIKGTAHNLIQCGPVTDSLTHTWTTARACADRRKEGDAVMNLPD